MTTGTDERTVRLWGSVGMAAAVGVLMTLVAAGGFRAYGWVLFVATPFLMGWMAAMWVSPTTVGMALGVAFMSMVVSAVLLIAVGLEGAICLLMALPLAVVPAALGGLAGWLVRRSNAPSVRAPWLGVALVVAAAPPLLAVESSRTDTAPLHRVVTGIDIDAPPPRVWQHVVSFSELPPPTEWIFRLGVAWPQRARIEGDGVGAVRYCEFSTGPFVEPITVWDAPSRLAFDVAQAPDPMREVNPFWNIRPAHLDGYLASERGEFRLLALPHGRTRLVGTTWYRHHMYPDAYWQAWSDFVIHRIHARVLRHVKTLAEGND